MEEAAGGLKKAFYICKAIQFLIMLIILIVFSAAAFGPNEGDYTCYGSNMVGQIGPLYWYDATSIVTAPEQLQVYKNLWATEGGNAEGWEDMTSYIGSTCTMLFVSQLLTTLWFCFGTFKESKDGPTAMLEYQKFACVI